MFAQPKLCTRVITNFMRVIADLFWIQEGSEPLSTR